MSWWTHKNIILINFEHDSEIKIFYYCSGKVGGSDSDVQLVPFSSTIGQVYELFLSNQHHNIRAIFMSDISQYPKTLKVLMLA
jgi:hypothetical protein